MDLSIIIPTRNAFDLLTRLLESLERSVHPGFTWEIVVVDNGSDPDTAANLQRRVRSAAVPARSISAPVQGKCRAVNLALQQVRSDYVAFLDHDVLVHKDYLIGIEETIASEPYTVYGGRVIPVWPYAPPRWITGSEPLMVSRGPIVVHDYGDRPRLYDHAMRHPVGCNFFCRRDLFKRYGYFDVRLGPGSGKGHMGGEESELLRRFIAGGEKLFYVPSVAVDHPVEPERMTKHYFRYRYFCAGRSIPYVIDKKFPTVLGVPRYHFREIASAGLRGLFAVCRFQPLRAFESQLFICENLGAMYEYWRLRGQTTGS